MTDSLRVLSAFQETGGSAEIIEAPGLCVAAAANECFIIVPNFAIVNHFNHANFLNKAGFAAFCGLTTDTAVLRKTPYEPSVVA